MRAEMVLKEKPSQMGNRKFSLGSIDLSKQHISLGLDDVNAKIHSLDEELTQAHLDKLIAVSLIEDMYDGKEPREKMMYFMEDGRVLKVNEGDLMIRTRKELEHVLYLFNIKNAACEKWERGIRHSIQVAKTGLMTEKEWSPKYIGHTGKEVEMKRNTAELETIAGFRVLSFNPESSRGCVIQIGPGMERSSISDLRAAIYQIGDSTEEHRAVKEQMIQTLKKKEEQLVMNFLNSEFMYRKIE